MIPWLDPGLTPHFPDTDQALDEPNGLLAAGGLLSIRWLKAAYQRGIFPWFNQGEPILWWSPAPRTVLFPSTFHTSRSLAKLARQGKYQLTCNQAFSEVIRACAARRPNQSGTWINETMMKAYQDAFEEGLARSVECFNEEGELVGGLYGIAIGQVFFGESMFSREANTSKLCLKHLIESGKYQMIDCQMPTGHLRSLGAQEISRQDFENRLAELL